MQYILILIDIYFLIYYLNKSEKNLKDLDYYAISKQSRINYFIFYRVIFG
jgi:hypothetical protein